MERERMSAGADRTVGEETGRGRGEKENGRQIITYCTGGIRCEKGARFLSENIGPGDSVYTLQGGIAAYLLWMEAEIAHGRKTAAESLFHGRNYVFDARGSTALGGGVEGEVLPVAECHLCKKPEDRLSKCHSRGCHLVLVVCSFCEEADPRCCRDCVELDRQEGVRKGPRPICECEKEREVRLWGKRDGGKLPKTHGGWKERKSRSGLNIQFKTID